MITSSESDQLPSRRARIRHIVEGEEPATFAVVIMAAAWLPTAILSAIDGPPTFHAFLVDVAAQSRLLVVIPLLIVAEPWILQRWAAIARHFLSAELIASEDQASFQGAVAAFERRRRLAVTHVVLALLVYSMAVAALTNLNVGIVPTWCSGSQVMNRFSFSGASYLLISLPMMMYLVLRWMWNIFLWSWFLYTVSRMNLRLVPAHPDLMGGLGFLETSMQGFLPFVFCIGTICAGGVANSLLHHRQPLSAFRTDALILAAFVVVICAGPLCILFDPLHRTKRRGTFEYGKFAVGLGHEFEAKWLGSSCHADQTTLEVPDFSSTTDLFSITANVRQMKLVPFGVHSLARLIIVTFAPAIAVALATVPFDTILDRVLKLLF